MQEKPWHAFGMKALFFVLLALGTVTAASTVRDALATELLASAAPTSRLPGVSMLTPHLALTATPSAQNDDTLYAELAADKTSPASRTVVASTEYPYAFVPGFSPDWTPVTLDGTVPVQVLGKPLPLKQTRQQLGAEYYEYSAYLFRQLAAKVKDAEMADQLEQLSRTAGQMGQRLQRASRLQFDGLPGEDLTHLKVRGQLLSQLDELNSRSLRVIDLDQNGQPVYPQQGQRDAYQAGALMQQFAIELDTLKRLPAARQYPQSLALVQHQATLMERLARNVELRWETVFHCDQPGQPARTLKMKLFASQTLTPEQIRMATADSLGQRISLGHQVQ